MKGEVAEELTVMVDVARGMAFLHNLSPPIMHRDLKPGNILIQKTQPARAQVTDFGLSMIMMSSGDVLRRAGTKGYMAPEVDAVGKLSSSGCEVEDIVPYGLAADVFSYGCVCSYVFSRQSPNDAEEAIGMSKAALETPLHELAAIALLCLQIDPSQRPTFKEIVSRLASEPDGVSTCEPTT